MSSSTQSVPTDWPGWRPKPAGFARRVDGDIDPPIRTTSLEGRVVLDAVGVSPLNSGWLTPTTSMMISTLQWKFGLSAL